MESNNLNLRSMVSFGRLNFPRPIQPVSLSRRDFLKCFSAAAITSNTPVSSFSSTLSQYGVRIVTSDNLAIFKIGSVAAWVIDTSRFSGTPRLKTKRNSNRITLELIGSLIPGTNISADFTCVLRRELFDWRLTLIFKGFPFKATISLTEWLLGTEPALCPVSSYRVLGQLCDTLALSITGDCLLKFSPNWQMEVVGDGEIGIGCREWDVVSKVAKIKIVGDSEPSVFANTPARRSIFLFARGERQWHLSSLLPKSPYNIIQTSVESFNHLALELGDSNLSGLSAAIIAFDSSDFSTISYLPGKSLKAVDGSDYKIPLTDVVFATTFNEFNPETIISGRIGRSRSLLDHDGYIMEAGYAEGVPPFELIIRNKEIFHHRCEPALIKVFTKMPDAVTGPMVFHGDTWVSFDNGMILLSGDSAAANIIGDDRLHREKDIIPGAAELNYGAFNTGHGHPGKQYNPLLLVASSTLQITKPIRKTSGPQRRKQKPAEKSTVRSLKESKPRVSPGNKPAKPVPVRKIVPVHQQGLVSPDLTVPVLRAEDFLCLTFHFYNLRLDPQKRTRLIRKNTGSKAYIAIQFPPQSILEETLFEEETSSDPAKGPPIQSRISGPSRLVFIVPEEVRTIPYSLTDLLEVCGKYAVRVPPTALPPPEQKDDNLSIRSFRSLAGKTKGRVAPYGLTAKSDVPQTIKTDLKAGKLSLRPGGPEKGRPPGPLETVIEMPYRLWLSPHKGAAWAHSAAPVKGHRDRIELWHTRLAVRGEKGDVDENNDYYRTLRAVWSPDYDQQNVPAAGTKSFLTSLDALDRHEIVALTSDFRIRGYTPLPVWAGRMMLTSYGAWLNSRGSWDPPCDHNARKKGTATVQKKITSPALLKNAESGGSCPTPGRGECSPGVWLNVEEWRHRATMGRDHYVRVVYKGYLFPFGHRASLIKVTERKFKVVEEGPLKGNVAAYLYQRIFIVVREPVLHYPIFGKKDRLNPFRKITVTTLTTPSLDKPAKTQIDGSDRQAFWVYVAGKPFLFSLTGEDWNGVRSDFTAPVIFLDQSKAKNSQFVTRVIRDEYEKDEHLEKRKRAWGGQRVAFAEITGANPMATTLDTHTFTFTAEQVECGDAPGDRPLFFPVMDHAQVRIPAVEALTGGQLTTIKMSKLYEQYGFEGKNGQGEIYAQVVGANPLIFNADQSGGVATPNINIAGLSRRMGPVGGNVAEQGKEPSILADFGAGTFDPEEYFKGVADEAMIFGGIKLFELFSTKMSSSHAPRLENRPVYKKDELLAIETRLIWEPPLEPRVKTFNTLKGKAKFKLEVLMVNSLDGNPPESSMRGVLTDFSIDLLADLGDAARFIVIEFASFEFISLSGCKTEVNPVIRDVRFAGALSYVNELAKFLSSDGVNIDVTPSGVTAGFNLAIPVINSGVMALQNISLSAGITIPFSGDPMRLRFAFCERNNPFLLTIYCFGGGGYVGLALGLDGVEQLEMAFEFGASCALDIGVASGGVEVMAGIYILADDDGCELTGYLRMSGELSVLGIVRLSIEFYMTLSHDTKTNKTWGECNLTVEIEIVFFSVSVSLHVRREFSEPTYLPFSEMMSQDSWTSYCEAFA
ncbi:hypothetical protein [Desulforhopalus singaporensis]|uniref:hypothetical protein n=1 Tax=Desulforhopalus singaporensis TaxID=91360 RepID=UPI00115FE265|nr:hypothetical protein [Desulforhopalus singaporensis]